MTVCGRGFRITLLLFEALWLNVIVPGHQRGIVRLPGDACVNCSQPSEDPPCCQTKEQPKSNDCPTRGDPAEHCAICHFAAMLMVPPAIEPSPPPHGLLELLPIPEATPFISPSLLMTYDGRAPPANSSCSA
jgi:hypothetical protein